MHSKLFFGLLWGLAPLGALHAALPDTTARLRVHPIDSVLIQGADSPARDLPGAAVVLGREQIVRGGRSSLLPALSEQVPGLFITGRGVMGFGVSGGASGQMNLRGVGGGASGGPTTGLLVLIDGQPQYMGLMGHPVADAYQSLLAERVEVTRGPASVLYGSNAMGGVVNIITRKPAQDGVRTDLVRITLWKPNSPTKSAKAASPPPFRALITAPTATGRIWVSSSSGDWSRWASK